MEALPPGYLSALAGQIAALSAFLGGFAATYLAMLLTLPTRGRAVACAIAGALVSAAAFVVATVAATVTMAGAHPDAPPAVAANLPLGLARVAMTLCFAVGLYGALVSIGCSGWVRSRRMVRLSTAIAAIAGPLVTALVVGVR